MGLRAIPCMMLAATLGAGAAEVGEPRPVNPAFPRIGTCYGAGLSWKTWEQGAAWWSKLDLIIGGGYDLHYDWDDPRWPKAIARLEENLGRLREASPHCLYLPYVDVVEGPDNPSLPAHWWDRRNGERWSGWPGIFNPPMQRYRVVEQAVPEVTVTAVAAGAVFRGVLKEAEQRIEFTETCTLTADNRLTLRFDFVIPQDLDLLLWRHYLAFPVRQYAGATAATADTTVILPAELGETQLLPAATHLTVTGPAARLEIASSIPLGLVDHRRWNTPEYLLAGYPLHGKVAAGTALSVELQIVVTPRP